MEKFIQFLNQSAIGLNITLLSSFLALLGGLYLAYEFTDRKWGFLRLPFQISLPMLAAILISIPPAILVYLIELLPPVQKLFNGIVPIPPVSFIVCGAFIGLFHGMFSNVPVGVKDKLQDTATVPLAGSKRKRHAWSRGGILQGFFWGGLLGFLYTFAMFAILTNMSQSLINLFYSQNFLPDLAASGGIGGFTALAGLVWRGRLHKPPSSQPKKTQRAQKNHLSWKFIWRLITYPFNNLGEFLFKDVYETQARKKVEQLDTSEPPISQLLLALQQGEQFVKKTPKPYKRFVKEEGILALNFWLVLVLLAILFIFIGLAITFINPDSLGSSISTTIYQYVFICLSIIFLVALPSWIAGGISSHSHRIAHRKLERGANKMLGYTGIILTLFAFALQLIQPLVQELMPPSAIQGSIKSIAWSPDGAKIAIAGYGWQADEIQIIQADTGKLIETYGLSSNLDTDATGLGMRWSDDGEFIASYDDSGNVQILNTSNGNSVFIQGVSHSWPSLAWWSPSSSTGDDYLAVAWDKTDILQVEDATTGTKGPKLSCSTAAGHSTDSVDWSPDGKYLASLYHYKKPDYETPLCIWNIQTRKRVANKQIPDNYNYFDSSITEYIDGLKWTSSEQQSRNPFMKEFFQPIGAKQNFAVYFYGLPPNSWPSSNDTASLAWSGNEMYLAISDNDRVNIWDMQQNRKILTYNGHYASVTVIAWSPDGIHVATGDENGVVEIWDATTGIHLLTYNSAS